MYTSPTQLPAAAEKEGSGFSSSFPVSVSFVWHEAIVWPQSDLDPLDQLIGWSELLTHQKYPYFSVRSGS